MKENTRAVFCMDDLDDTPSSSVGFVQTFLDKTATSSKITTLLTCPVHTVLYSSFMTHKRWITKNLLPSVGFLPEQFEATVEADPESYLRYDSEQY